MVSYGLKNNIRSCRTVLLAVSVILFSMTGAADAARIKDIASIKGIRTNQLTGYGIIVGLDGTGDKSGSDFTTQGLANMMERMGISVDKNALKIKNIAAVMVTADIPPFARIGNKLDVVASSVGDAKSLSGGTLILTPLKGVDGKVYALAQGPVTVGGTSAGGAGGGQQKNHLLVARIANGATVEREIPMPLDGKKSLTLSLLNPDFTTAARVADTINASIGKGVAETIDASGLKLNIPADMQESRVAEFIADIEGLVVVPDNRARVVVNEKTGTVVIGDNVTISTVAVAHGNLTVTIKNGADVSQPQPLTQGQTVVTPNTNVNVQEEKVNVITLEGGTTIGELVSGLNSIGATPRDLITILQSIKAAGALQADLEII